MTFGQNLERLRKEKKLNQSELGRCLGLTQQMISSYEKDLSSPNLDVLIKLSDYFQVSIDTLAGHIVDAPQFNTKEARFLRYFESLNQVDREKCITIAETLLTDRNMK